MRKVIALCFIAIFASPIISNACTTFFINKNGEMVFGRNYDWITASGMLCSNLRGISKTSMKTEDGSTISWTSKYGSLSFNQYGKEFPTGGMNEQGLVVELMWLDDTKYPKPDKRPAIGVLQWIQYQLDNCSNIDEVISTDKVVRIASVGTTPLHYLIADARGKVATIEFLDGKLTVHRDEQVAIPVLTNDIYGLSYTAYMAAFAMGAAKPISLGNNSLDRFSQACNMVDDFKKSSGNTASALDYSFDILNEVSQGDFTKWSIVYDLAKKEIYFRTNKFRDRKVVRFAALNFDCKAKPMGYDINQIGSNEISSQMKELTQAMNKTLVETSFKESAERIKLNPDRLPAIWKYGLPWTCN